MKSKWGILKTNYGLKTALPQIPDAALGIDIISVLSSILNASVKYQKSSEGLIEQMVMIKTGQDSVLGLLCSNITRLVNIGLGLHI